VSDTIQKLKAQAMELRKSRSPLGAVLQFHIAEVDKIGKTAGNRVTTEDEAIQYLKKSVQKLKENQFADQSEIAVLEALLPRMATREEVVRFLETIDRPNKGVVMKAVREKFGSLVDMKMVGEIVG
jgi:hypothetical protein